MSQHNKTVAQWWDQGECELSG